MRKILIYSISILLILNPSFVYSKSILKKTNFYQIINCENIKSNFQDFIDCVDNETLYSEELSKLKYKKFTEIQDIIAIINILNKSVEEKFLNDKLAFQNLSIFLNSNYKSKSSKKKLEKILDQSNCTDKMKYEEFIECFNGEFRMYDIYQSANIRTKERIEHIVFNSLILTKSDGIVITLKKNIIGDLFEDQDIYENDFIEGEGYDFFLSLMGALGTNYFVKPDYKVKKYNFKPSKDFSEKNKTEWGKVIKFILIAIVVAYAAKGLIKAVKGVKTTGSAASSNATSASSGSYSLSTSGVAAKGSLGKNLFRYAPKSSVLNKPWFKYTLLRGGF